MQIESLKVFCDAVEAQSFTKAAKVNQVSQSAVSQQLSSMEQLFNSLLIERSTRQFRLTQEGEAIYEHSKQIVQTYDLMVSKVQEVKDIVSGSIRIATIDSIGLHELPRYVTQFVKSHPKVNVHVEYRSDKEVYDDVLENLVDLGLVSYPEKSGKLEVVPLWKDKLVLICHPQNPLAKNKSIKLADIAGQKFVGFEPEIPMRKAIDKILRKHRVTVQRAMEFDNVETVKRAVEIDAGISIVPATTIVQELAQKTLAAVEFLDGNFVQPSAAIYRRNKVLSPGMKQFLATLKE